MNQKTKELWVIPIIVGVVTGTVVAFVFLFIGAWMMGQPLMHKFSFDWFVAAMQSRVPIWAVLMMVVVLAGITGLYFSQRARTAYAKLATQHLEGELRNISDERARILSELTSGMPKLHGVWIPTQAYWAYGQHGADPATQVVGWIDISSSNTDENIFLLAGYINGRRAPIFGDVTIKPGVINKGHIFLFFWPPLDTIDGEPFEAVVVVEDQFNRKYNLPLQEFHATPGQKPIAAPHIEPKLHLAWRFVGWCWTDASEIKITGDGTLVLDNVKEDVIFTGIKVEGCEVVSVFDGFTLKPSEPYFTGIEVTFKTAKGGFDDGPIRAKLTFVDLRGNEYPIEEREFKLLEHPERFGGIPF